MSGGTGERHRSPARPPRMAALAQLPIFLALEGKRAVIAGDAPAVAWKAELLSAAGADVDVFAEHPCGELRVVAAQPPRGAVALRHRAWRAGDFGNAVVAVGGFDDDREAERFAGAARAAGVAVNVIDKPAYCDFSFGAIVNRSPLIIGISTDGAAPVFAQAIRARLEAMIPDGFAHWVDAARRWRPAVRSSGLAFAARRRFWQEFTAFALAHSEREPAPSDFDACMHEGRHDAGAGSVTLVDAGPGDPELLTLRALRALQSADVILMDGPVSPAILDFARREAEKMLVDPASDPRKQNESTALIIALAKAGKRVVRLRSGDPLILGRASDEIAACRAAGIALEVVPGINPSAVIRMGRSEIRDSGRADRSRRTPVRGMRTTQGDDVNSPGTPLPACCGSPAAPPGGRARARRSTSRG
jgi:uroporphyrin-III C-methyltransferase / precorrin-2 dehydrogenase / sirohydrochlorin ferrochelatase